MIAIVKHRVKEQNAGQIIKKIVPGWSWHDNYNSNTRGRIWILWDHNVIDYTPLQVASQYIHGLVKFQATEFYFTAIYGLHTVEIKEVCGQN